MQQDNTPKYIQQNDTQDNDALPEWHSAEYHSAEWYYVLQQIYNYI